MLRFDVLWDCVCVCVDPRSLDVDPTRRGGAFGFAPLLLRALLGLSREIEMNEAFHREGTLVCY